jgi:hypothetical protein
MIKMFSFLLLFPNMVLIYISKLGRDDRIKEDKDLDLDSELISKIKINLIKKHILEQLLSKTISEIDKLHIIENELTMFNSSIFLSNSIYTPNLYSGDLYKDYNFTLL